MDALLFYYLHRDLEFVDSFFFFINVKPIVVLYFVLSLWSTWK